MKKIKALFSVLAICAAVTSFAQSSGIPEVRLGVLASQKKTVTRAEIMANTQVVVMDPGATVKSYKASITAKGKTFGPVVVKGSALPDALKQKLMSDEYSTGSLHIDNVHIDFQGKEVTTNTLNIDYTK